MTLVKFRPARRIYRNINAHLSDHPETRGTREDRVMWSPRVDISENENAIGINVELPGVRKKDVEVSIKDSVLTIRGEKQYEKNNSTGTKTGKEAGESEDRRAVYRESKYGRFERFFRLTVPVQEDAISASYRNGILAVHVPKAAVPEPQKIEVK